MASDILPGGLEWDVVSRVLGWVSRMSLLGG